MCAYPVAGGELSHLRTPMFIVDVFDARRLFKMRELQEPRQPTVLAVRRFAVNKQREAFIKGEFVGIGLFELLREGISHAREFKRA